jgi:ADP-ribosylglycohydrolase
MPFERPRDQMHPDLEGWEGEMRPGTHHKLPAGHWTDDTEMAVALSEALIEADGAYEGDRVARAYYDWSRGTPHGMGGTTRKAMENLARGTPFTDSGVAVNYPYEVGAGTIMRCAPLGVVFGRSGVLNRIAMVDALITHRHTEAVAATVALVNVIDAVLRIPNISGQKLLETAIMAMATEDQFDGTVVRARTELVLESYEREEPIEFMYQKVTNTGQAFALLPTALACAAYHVDDYRAGVIAAVRGGGDTDTRAAVTGAILGARNGAENIPREYLEQVLRLHTLQELDRELYRLREGRVT